MDINARERYARARHVVGAGKAMAAFVKYRSANPLALIALLAGFLIGGLPSLTGLTVVSFDSKPAFTLDICHPSQSAESPAAPVFALPEPAFSLRPILYDFGAQIQAAMFALKDRGDPPDTPPPK